jgi:hypothetical protein
MISKRVNYLDIAIILLGGFIGLQVALMPEFVADDHFRLKGGELYAYLIRTPHDPNQDVAKHELTNTVLDNLLRYAGQLTSCLGVCLPFLTLGTAIAIFRHQSGRAPCSRRHVGVLTVAVATAFITARISWEYVSRLTYGTAYWMGGPPLPLAVLLRELSFDISVAIAALWASLAFSGSWRTFRSQSELVGCVLGLLWITYAVLMRL